MANTVKSLFEGKMEYTRNIIQEELYETFKERTKIKRYTRQTYELESKAGRIFDMEAEAIESRQWNVIGYKEFPIYHPSRIIRAPHIVDRVVESWYIDEFIANYWQGKLTKGNSANQRGKGQFYAIGLIKEEMTRMWHTYRDQWWYYQFDMEKYFDNMRHEIVLEKFKNIDDLGYYMLEQTLKSYHSVPAQKEAYYAKEHPDDPSGLPKGNLPSQWCGVVYLDSLDHELENQGTFCVRYMDDGWMAFPDKEACAKTDRFVRQYLSENEMGVRLNAKKTHYAPIKNGFTFCGWRLYYDDKGEIHMRVRNSTKTIMENRLKIIKKLVEEEKFDRMKARTILDGMVHYLMHGTDSEPLIKYFYKHYYI